MGWDGSRKNSLSSNKQKNRSLIDANLGNPGGSGGGSTWQEHKKGLSAENQTSNRKVILTVRADFLSYEKANHVAYFAWIEVIAMKRMWWKLGGWGQYNTRIHSTGTINNGDDFIIETPWGTKSYDVLNYSTPEDVASYTLDCLPFEGWPAYPGPEIYIRSAHLKAWTRGTTDQIYAEINYDL